MTVKQLTEHHLEFLSLKRGYTGLSETTLVKLISCCSSNYDVLQSLKIIANDNDTDPDEINGIARTLKKLRTSKGYYWIKQ